MALRCTVISDRDKKNLWAGLVVCKGEQGYTIEDILCTNTKIIIDKNLKNSSQTGHFYYTSKQPEIP